VLAKMPQWINLFGGVFCKIRLIQHNASGHDFSRAERTTKICRALAPAAFIFSDLQLRSG
jgi:hypothetical protein